MSTNKSDTSKVKSTEKRPAIDKEVRLKLWVKAGGRCQYEGCNKLLNRDEIKRKDLNISYMAHIYGYASGSARYDKILSPKLVKDFSNLMLMCDSCHRRIDVEEKELHSATMLIDMKKKHEDRIENLTSIKEEVKTQVILYTSKIGVNTPSIDFNAVRNTLAKRSLYPINEAVNLSLDNVSIEDNENLFWQIEERNLTDNFDRLVSKHFKGAGINHFSLFAIATQPLLIKLGTLIPELYTVDVYQKHRPPIDSWDWQVKSKFSGFKIIEPDDKTGIPVLNISLSANILNDRIDNTIAESTSIWQITIDEPNPIFLTHPDILDEFRIVVRNLFNRIKTIHGHDAVLKVFPAMPVSACVEFGRVWMPKADMQLEIYDERDGFKKAITINRN